MREIIRNRSQELKMMAEYKMDHAGCVTPVLLCELKIIAPLIVARLRECPSIAKEH